MKLENLLWENLNCPEKILQMKVFKGLNDKKQTNSQFRVSHSYIWTSRQGSANTWRKFSNIKTTYSTETGRERRKESGRKRGGASVRSRVSVATVAKDGDGNSQGITDAPLRGFLSGDSRGTKEHLKGTVSSLYSPMLNESPVWHHLQLF